MQQLVREDWIWVHTLVVCSILLLLLTLVYQELVSNLVIVGIVSPIIYAGIDKWYPIERKEGSNDE